MSETRTSSEEPSALSAAESFERSAGLARFVRELDTPVAGLGLNASAVKPVLPAASLNACTAAFQMVGGIDLESAVRHRPS
jgi:hypothetical protein